MSLSNISSFSPSPCYDLEKHCDPLCDVQGPTGRPGMIGQPGVVGEKVKTGTSSAHRRCDSVLVVDFLHISFHVSKGEDGEAGDPGSVGTAGRIVSLFAQLWRHIFITNIFRLPPVLKLLLLFFPLTQPS